MQDHNQDGVQSPRCVTTSGLEASGSFQWEVEALRTPADFSMVSGAGGLGPPDGWAAPGAICPLMNLDADLGEANVVPLIGDALGHSGTSSFSPSAAALPTFGAPLPLCREGSACRQSHVGPARSVGSVVRAAGMTPSTEAEHPCELVAVPTSVSAHRQTS